MAKSNSVGTKFLIGAAPSSGSSTQVEVGGLTSIGGIEISADTIDVSDLANTDGYREKLAGFKDGGEVSLSGFLNGDDDGQEDLYDLLESGAQSAFQIVFPTAIGKAWSFNGSVIGFSTSADVGDAITFECTIAVSGKPTLA